MKKILIALVLPLAIYACGPSTEALASQTAVEATTVAAAWTRAQTQIPSDTPPPSATHTIKPTPTPTREPGRYYEDEGGFSYIPPDGWVLEEFFGWDYKLVFGPTFSDFTSSIVIVEEPYLGSMDEYLEARITSYERVIPSLEILEIGDFLTDSGLHGKRVVSNYISDGRFLRSIEYFFLSAGRYIVVTCMRIMEAGEEIDLLCDACMKTFRLETE